MIAAIIQARLGSTRLPGKTLMEICGRPLLGHLVQRVKRIPEIQQVVIATTEKPADTAIIRFAEANGLPVHLGSETDVLDRFYQAARRFGISVVVRVTPDCPMLDPEVARLVLDCFLRANGSLDYTCNTHPPTYPNGLETEVFSFAALHRAWREATSLTEREHVTPYIWKNPRNFRIANVRNARDLSALRWTVDECSDFEFVRAVYERLWCSKPDFGMTDVLELIEKEPELMKISQGIIRNAGYYKSLAEDRAVPPQTRMLNRSLELKARARDLIPSGTQTFSKGPTQFVQGVAPVFLERGEGSHVWDVDGNEYIDYVNGLGPVILGYGYPAVNEAVSCQLQKGASFSLPHPLEIELAELLCEAIPCADMVRFGKNGSDATSGAVRAARAYTGRDRIACCGYHGWQDWYIGTTTRNKGVPKAVSELTLTFSYNDAESLEQIFTENPGQIAAVILEPVGVVEPKPGFLSRIADLSRRNGALLIFDEIVSGFRWSLGGAQEYFGVLPDMACFGKAMANGLPISAVVGRRDVMEVFDEIFFSLTFGGEALSLAAAVATIREIRQKNVIRFIWEQGRILQDGYNALARGFALNRCTECIGYPCRTVMTFKDSQGQESLLLKSLFQQEVLKRGVLSAGYHLVSFSHEESDVDYTLRVYRAALEKLALAIRSQDPARYLEGEPVQPVFRRL